MSQEVGDEGLGAPWKGERVDKGAQEKFVFQGNAHTRLQATATKQQPASG